MLDLPCQLPVLALLALQLAGQALDQQFSLVVDVAIAQFVLELVVLGLEGQQN